MEEKCWFGHGAEDCWGARLQTDCSFLKEKFVLLLFFCTFELVSEICSVAEDADF